jgi:PTH1 family peptidyl-tRNA hydrolase
MKLIVGLGNPGRIYIDSRHNIGFLVVKRLAKLYRFCLKRDSHTFSLSGKCNIEGNSVVVAMPLTFMNLSGSAVAALLKKYKIGLGNLLVICDDLDLELGRQKVKASGGAGGHRGLKSIIESIGSQDFCRLRIGINRPQKNTDVTSFVLSSFTKREKGALKEIIDKAVSCCRVWVTKGVVESMNIFNKRTIKNE